MVLPPSRPDTWQLTAIAKLLNPMARNGHIAVLGSTPEFRDLLAEMQFENIHIFERNEAFHHLVSKERIYQNPEFLVWGNWLDTLHSVATGYAAILSDLTSGNIDYVNRAHLYAGVARLLEPG